MAVETTKKRKSDDEEQGDSPESVLGEAGDQKVNIKKAKITEAKPKAPKGNKKGSGSGSGPKTPWTDDRDDLLRKLVKKQKNKEIGWPELCEIFNGKFPDDNRSVKSLGMRWDKIKGDPALELDDDQKKHFKKSVQDVDTEKFKFTRIDLITMRYNQLAGASISKNASVKLLKLMEKWNLDNEDGDDEASNDGDDPEDDNVKEEKKDVKKEINEEKKDVKKEIKEEEGRESDGDGKY